MKKSVFLALLLSASFSVFSQDIPPNPPVVEDPHPTNPPLDYVHHLDVDNCYQHVRIDPNTGGTYTMLGGQPIVFSGPGCLSTNVTIYTVDDSNTSTFYATANMGDLTILPFNTLYRVVTPNDANIDFRINVLDPAALVTDNNHDGCFGFDEPFHLNALDLSGVCNFFLSYQSSDPVTTFREDHGDLYVESNGFCTPPPGQNWAPGTMRCADVYIFVTFLPCKENDPNCPPYILSQHITCCCNNCFPYGLEGRAATVTGIATVTKGTSFDLYPNPGRQVTFKASDAGTLSIRNLLGETVKQLSTTANAEVVISDLAEGNYICTFSAGSKTPVVKKLIVLH